VPNTIPASRRLLGAALRRFRESAGLSLRDAAELLECDPSKISRMETGERGIRAKELRELLNDYGATPREQEILSVLARRPGEHGWWDEFGPFLPEAYRDYLAMESVASHVMTYQAQAVPPLLQTEDYARAVASSSPDIPQDWEEQLVQVVLTRQRVVLAQRSTLVDAVISEAVLRQEVGGRTVVRNQLSMLADLAEGSDPQVSVRVLPHSAGATAALSIGSPTLLSFSNASRIGIVHLPGLAGGVCFEDPATVGAYVGALTQVKAIALSPRESARMIRSRIRT
jgi:transcriptional regulator with XRE-family HTH domain